MTTDLAQIVQTSKIHHFPLNSLEINSQPVVSEYHISGGMIGWLSKHYSCGDYKAFCFQPVVYAGSWKKKVCRESSIYKALYLASHRALKLAFMTRLG